MKSAQKETNHFLFFEKHTKLWQLKTLKVLFEGFVILPGDWKGEVGRNLRGGETAAGFRWWGRGSVTLYQRKEGNSAGKSVAEKRVTKIFHCFGVNKLDHFL